MPLWRREIISEYVSLRDYAVRAWKAARSVVQHIKRTEYCAIAGAVQRCIQVYYIVTSSALSTGIMTRDYLAQPSYDQYTVVATQITQRLDCVTAAWPTACRWLCMDLVESCVSFTCVRSYGQSA
jgi:hypothetical protein